MCEVRSLVAFFFFFSSRRRHTRFDCDWSSDVCSSDLHAPARGGPVRLVPVRAALHQSGPGRRGGGGAGARRGAPQRSGGRADVRRQGEIGRASCRERVEISVGAVSLKKKKKKKRMVAG